MIMEVNQETLGGASPGCGTVPSRELLPVHAGLRAKPHCRRPWGDEAGDGEGFVVVPSAQKNTLRLFNVANGLSRRLYPVAGAGTLRYQSGEGWAVKEPRAVRGVPDGPRGPATLRWEEAGKAPVKGARLPIASEPLEFESQGLKLTGRLYLPDGRVPTGDRSPPGLGARFLEGPTTATATCSRPTAWGFCYANGEWAARRGVHHGLPRAGRRHERGRRGA